MWKREPILLPSEEETLIIKGLRDAKFFEVSSYDDQKAEWCVVCFCGCCCCRSKTARVVMEFFYQSRRIENFNCFLLCFVEVQGSGGICTRACVLLQRWGSLLFREPYSTRSAVATSTTYDV